MRKILEACPTCGGTLEIREVVCVNCATEVRSHYRPCDFCTLTDEQATFVRLFVLNRGNLSEMEKVLGVSYPTVRAKLDEIAGRLRTPVSATLTATVPPIATQPVARSPLPQPVNLEPASAQPGAGPSTARRQILDLVASGRLAAADALVHLRNIAGTSANVSTTPLTAQPTAQPQKETAEENDDLGQEYATEAETEASASSHDDSQVDNQQATPQSGEQLHDGQDDEYSAEQKVENEQ